MPHWYLTKPAKQYNSSDWNQVLLRKKKEKENKLFPSYVDNYAQNWRVPPSQTKMVLIQRWAVCSIVDSDPDLHGVQTK